MPEPPKDPNFHWGWIHTIYLFLGLSPLAALKKVRQWFGKGLRFILNLMVDKLKEDTTSNHDLNTALLSAMDKTAAIAQSSAQDVKGYATEMRNTAELIGLSQKGMREEVDTKVGGVYDRVNEVASKVDNLSGKLEVLIPLVQEAIKR